MFGVTLYISDTALKLMMPARNAVCEISSSPWKKARTERKTFNQSSSELCARMSVRRELLKGQQPAASNLMRRKLDGAARKLNSGKSILCYKNISQSLCDDSTCFVNFHFEEEMKLELLRGERVCASKTRRENHKRSDVIVGRSQNHDRKIPLTFDSFSNNFTRNVFAWRLFDCCTRECDYSQCKNNENFHGEKRRIFHLNEFQFPPAQ